MDKQAKNDDRKNLRIRFRDIFLEEERNLSKYATRDRDALRRAPLSFECIRPNFWRDSDRILHSFAFNRFLDKTQVFYLNDNIRLTHRMLHVQLVAKIGRLLAKCLRLNTSLVEAIALGHDIGHCPFGHEGERILSQLSRAKLGKHFRHSVQSVRFLNILEENSQKEGAPAGRGLNLTLQVLDGILCHDGEDLQVTINPDRSKTIEKFTRQYHDKMEGKANFIQPMTLEGCLARFCDVIAYIGRDIEDAIAIGLIDRFPDNPLGSSTGQIIDALVMDLLANSENKDRISYSKKTFKALEELYKFNMKNIYRNPLIMIHNRKIERLFIMMFDEILKDLEQGNRESPVFKDHVNQIERYYPNYIESTKPAAQVVVDFISSMTDRQFLQTVSDMFFPGPLPTNYADLSRITGLPEGHLDNLFRARKPVDGTL